MRARARAMRVDSAAGYATLRKSLVCSGDRATMDHAETVRPSPQYALENGYRIVRRARDADTDDTDMAEYVYAGAGSCACRWICVRCNHACG